MHKQTPLLSPPLGYAPIVLFRVVCFCTPLLSLQLSSHYGQGSSSNLKLGGFGFGYFGEHPSGFTGLHAPHAFLMVHRHADSQLDVAQNQGPTAYKHQLTSYTLQQRKPGKTQLPLGTRGEEGAASDRSTSIGSRITLEGGESISQVKIYPLGQLCQWPKASLTSGVELRGASRPSGWPFILSHGSDSFKAKLSISWSPVLATHLDCL